VSCTGPQDWRWDAAIEDFALLKGNNGLQGETVYVSPRELAVRWQCSRSSVDIRMPRSAMAQAKRRWSHSGVLYRLLYKRPQHAKKKGTCIAASPCQTCGSGGTLSH
jgi:hypothetical protein